jgi:glycosyltransferase involved in cell wall biosynthesis
LPLTVIPWRRAVLEWSWNLVRRPTVDRWSGPCDWIYCPAETYVPTKRAQLAVTIHDVSFLEPDSPWARTADAQRNRRVWLRRLRPIIKHADVILTVSEFSAQRIRALLGPPKGRIVIVGNGVEDVFYADIPPLIVDDRLRDRPYVAIVGGLDERKGVDIIFAVAEELQRRGSDLAIAVAGHVAEHWRQQAEKNSQLILLGYVDTTKLPALLKQSVALLFPSRYEGFGIPALEAMAAGTPAVVSRLTALPEIVGSAGIYVDVNRPTEIADQLLELQKNDAWRQQFIALGRPRAEPFRWTQCVERLVSALQTTS